MDNNSPVLPAKSLTPEQAKAWENYWKGLGPRPIPVDMDAVRRVAEQIRARP